MTVSSLYMYAGNAMIFMALCSVYWWRKRRLVAWPYFLWGVLAWVVAACARLGWSKAFAFSLDPSLAWVVNGATAALIESAILLIIILRVHRLGTARRDDAVAFGIGVGAAGTLFYGLGVIFSLLSTLLLMSTRMKPEEIHNFHLAGAPLAWTLVPIATQAGLMFVHAAQGAWLIYAARTGKWRYSWLATAYVAAAAALVLALFDQFTLQRLGAVWGLEAVLAAWAWLGYRSLKATADRFTTLPRAEVITQKLSEA